MFSLSKTRDNFKIYEFSLFLKMTDQTQIFETTHLTLGKVYDRC